MRKLFIALIISSAAVSGFYGFTKTAAVEEKTVVLTEAMPAPAVENKSITVISDPGALTALDQSKATTSAPTAVAEQLTASSGAYIAADDYSYQREQGEVTNVGVFVDADDNAYQRDDSEVINVGEFVDADILESTYQVEGAFRNSWPYFSQ